MGVTFSGSCVPAGHSVLDKIPAFEFDETLNFFMAHAGSGRGGDRGGSSGTYDIPSVADFAGFAGAVGLDDEPVSEWNSEKIFSMMIPDFSVADNRANELQVKHADITRWKIRRARPGRIEGVV